jgi:hypothetical protein
MARQEPGAGAALVSAGEVSDPFIQFVLQTCETDNRLRSQARKVSAPPIHSSLLRIYRQRLSAGFAQALERPPLLRRRLRVSKIKTAPAFRQAPSKGHSPCLAPCLAPCLDGAGAPNPSGVHLAF